MANWSAALSAVDPLNLVARHLPPQPKSGRCIVLGAGKGAARMARAVEAAWSGPLEGFVVTRYAHGDDCTRIEVVEAAHPVPDAAGAAAAARMLELARSARAGDTVLALISGGGSALLSLPAEGISAERKRAVHKALLASGAPIDEMNLVRSHLSAIKGGRLGAACGAAAVITQVLSDVPGDDPGVVASGPTIARPHEPDAALEVLRRYSIALSQAEQTALRNNCAADAALGPREVCLLATASDALEAACAHGMAQGFEVSMLGPFLEGEAREMGRVLGGVLREKAQLAQRSGKPQLVLSGGEATVTVRHPSPGRGGRCTEFLLGAALACAQTPNAYLLACDTDGIDGSESNAGAWMSTELLAKARAAGLDPQDFLERHDAYGFFEATGSLIITGPTRTNVNDFRALLVLPS